MKASTAENAQINPCHEGGRLCFFPVISDVQLGPFLCVSGHGPTAKIPYLPLPINTQSLGWEAKPTGLDAHFVKRKAALSELPKM